jgi:hypothetical protein
MIGFHYQRTEPVAAADDFVQHLRDIGQAIRNSDQPPLVSVILDGENCWEHFPGGGVAFLRALYERCSTAKDIQPVQVGTFLEQHPPRDTLPHLFAGSWIHHNFAIWVGHEEDNTAWDALHRAREHLRQRARQTHVAPDCIRQAWEEIYIAEGSDWFWWYGDEHRCAQDALFDYLFRKHLQNVYVLLGDTPPSDLERPIMRRGQRVTHTLPRAFLDVQVDGRRSFLQWIGAGRYTCQHERGTMAMGTRGPIQEVHFGFNRQALLVRVDLVKAARVVLADFDALRVGFVEPAGYDLLVSRPGLSNCAGAQLLYQGEPVAAANVVIGIDQIVELAIPFERLGVGIDQPLNFFVELLEARQSRDRAPREGTINLTRPSHDFEQIMWDV